RLLCCRACAPSPRVCPYTPLFRSHYPLDGQPSEQFDAMVTGGTLAAQEGRKHMADILAALDPEQREVATTLDVPVVVLAGAGTRSEEHTSELQSRFDLVCRLLLEK